MEEILINLDHLPQFDPSGLLVYSLGATPEGLCVAWYMDEQRRLLVFHPGALSGTFLSAPRFVSLADARTRDALLRYLAVQAGWGPLLEVAPPEWYWADGYWCLSAVSWGEKCWPGSPPDYQRRLVDGSSLEAALAFKQALLTTLGRVPTTESVIQDRPRRALPTLTPDELDTE